MYQLIFLWEKTLKSVPFERIDCIRNLYKSDDWPTSLEHYHNAETWKKLSLSLYTWASDKKKMILKRSQPLENWLETSYDIE